MLEAAIDIVEAGGDLPMEQMAAVMGRIMDGACQEAQIARLLAALHRKGETRGRSGRGGGRHAASG